MLKEITLAFIKKQILDLNDFAYKLEEDGEYIHIIFNEAFGKDIKKEFTFKLIDKMLFMHTTSYGWKPIEKGSANKYFWIELLK